MKFSIMTDKKKKYLAPEMKVVVIDQADIIATSNEEYGNGSTDRWYNN